MLAVAHVLGSMMALFGVTYLLPIVCSLLLRDGIVADFIIAAGVNVIVGVGIAAATRRFKRELKPRDGFVLVTLSWVLMSGSATLPFLISIPGLTFTDAYFEAMSGFTTTGSTILTGLDSLPPSLNLWRASLHWYGGIGIIVFAVAVLPLLGVGGMQLYKAETPGPVKDEKLTPRITETAKALWLTYTGFTLVCIVALRVAGMDWLDAVCHSFSVMGLGGFSTHDASIAYFNSPAIEFVLIVFMVAASMNFARHFVAFRKMSLAPYRTDTEAKSLLALLAVSVIAVALLLVIHRTYPSVPEALRHAAFNVVSMASTTGLVSQDFEKWPAFAPIWMLFLCCITCSTGSTGGGVKMFRTLLLARQASREMLLLVHPSAVAPVRIGGQVIPDRIAYSVLAFIFLYFFTIVTLTFAMLLSGVDLDTAFSAIVASVNNTGPGLAGVGPSQNYASLSDFQTWVCTAAMLLGRLEIFSVLVLFTGVFWRR
jgi:trk system potassium uptake protein TrkH